MCKRTAKMVQVVEARRGKIVDSRGNLLATTHTTIDLGVDPQSFREEDRSKLPLLAELNRATFGKFGSLN